MKSTYGKQPSAQTAAGWLHQMKPEPIRLWRTRAGADVASHALPGRFGAQLGQLDDEWVLIGERGQIQLWNPTTNETRCDTIAGAQLNALAISPDATTLAVGDIEGQITILKARTCEIERAWAAHTGEVRALRFLPDGETLATAGSEPTIRLWNWHTGQNTHTLKGHQNDVNALLIGFERDMLISAASDGTIRLWNWQTGQTDSLLEANGPVLTVALSPDQTKLAEGGYSGTRVWNLADPQSGPIRLPDRDPVRSLAFSPDGQYLASGGEDGAIRIWHLKTLEAIVIPAHSGYWVTSLAFDHERSQLLSLGRNGQIRLWPTQKRDILLLGCRRAGRNLTDDEWIEAFGEDIPLARPCPETETEGWQISQSLTHSRIVAFPSDHTGVGLPVILYFEAIPGTKVKLGESIRLRWHAANTSELLLNYDNGSYGVKAPQEDLFQPRVDTTYYLIAKNRVGAITRTLKISVNR